MLVSETKVNDSESHTVMFKRRGRYGELIVDKEPKVTGYSEGPSDTMNLSPPFYVGGIQQDATGKVFNTIVRNSKLLVLNALVSGR